MFFTNGIYFTYLHFITHLLRMGYSRVTPVLSSAYPLFHIGLSSLKVFNYTVIIRKRNLLTCPQTRKATNLNSVIAYHKCTVLCHCWQETLNFGSFGPRKVLASISWLCNSNNIY